MKPDERDLRDPTDPEQISWREAEEELLAQAREVARAIAERVRAVAGEVGPALSHCLPEE